MDENLVFAAGDGASMLRFTGKPPLLGGNIWIVVAIVVIAATVAQSTRMHARRPVGS